MADDIVIASGLPGVRYPSASGAAYVVFGPRDGGAGTRFRRGAVRGEEEINLSDAIVLLGHLFQGGEAPPDPGPASCGRDPTEDELDCASSTPDCGN